MILSRMKYVANSDLSERRKTGRHGHIIVYKLLHGQTVAE